MSSPWTISPAVQRLELSAGRTAELTVTVTNTGPTAQRAVCDVVTSENAKDTWITVIEPQRLVPAGGSVSYLFQIKVPAEAPPGGHWLAGRVYTDSPDLAPEETSVLSDRVTFEVKPGGRPPPPKWPWLVAAAVLVLVVVGVVAFLLTRNGDPQGGETTTTPPSPTTPSPTLLRSSSLTLTQNSPIDLDEIFVDGPAADQDLRFEGPVPSDRSATPANGAQLAEIGPAGANPVDQCLSATLTSQPVRVRDWNIGEVLCVRTGRGRLSVLILDTKRSTLQLPPPPAQLGVRIQTFETGGR